MASAVGDANPDGSARFRRKVELSLRRLEGGSPFINPFLVAGNKRAKGGGVVIAVLAVPHLASQVLTRKYSLSPRN